MSSPHGDEPTQPTQPFAFTKPATPAPAPAPPYAPYAPAGLPPRSGWGAGRIIAIVLATLLTLFGLGVLTAGGLLAWAHESRDGAGFISTSSEPLATPTAALSSDKVSIDVGGTNWFADHLGTIRITATSRNGKPVFVGIAAQADVVSWLGSSSADRIKDVQFEPFSVSLTRTPGTVAAVQPPQAQPFWTARSTGTTTQTLTWKVTKGDWAVVIANADGSPGVAVQARLGAKFSWLGPLSIGLIVGGIVLLLIGLGIVIVAVRSRPRTRPQPEVGSRSAFP
jgi:hypothetical protein